MTILIFVQTWTFPQIFGIHLFARGKIATNIMDMHISTAQVHHWRITRGRSLCLTRLVLIVAIKVFASRCCCCCVVVVVLIAMSFPEAVILLVSTKNRDLWYKDEPALVTAVTLSTHVQKPSLNLNTCPQSNRNDIFCFRYSILSRASGVRSPLTTLGTTLLILLFYLSMYMYLT